MTYSSLRVRIAVAAVIVNFCTLLATPAQSSGDPDTLPHEVVEKARASIVLLTGVDKAGASVSPGIGFWIGGNLIATDKRVVQSAVRVHVTIPGQESNPMEVTSRQSLQFAAILTVAGTQGASPLLFGDSDKVVVNDTVYLVGDSASPPVASERRLEKIAIFNEGRYFQLAAPLSSASRGGPVLNSKGEVIGIAGAGLDGANETLVIPAAYLTTLLRERNVATAGGGMGSGGGMGTGPARSTGAGQGSNVVGGGGQSGGPQPSAKPVDIKPLFLKKVYPRYTEEARKNNIQGAVTLRILVGEDGEVKRAMVVRGLPDGLNEQAIAAAYQTKFKPAMRDGLAVSHWMVIEMEFTLR